MGNFTLSISNPTKEDADYFRELGKKAQKPLNIIFGELIAMHKSGGTMPAKEVDNNAIIEENVILKSDLQNQAEMIQGQAETIETLKNQLSELSKLSKPAEVTPPSYIYTPAPEQLKQMQRFFALQRKKGLINTNTQNLPQSLTARSITYFFKNEYPEVIK